MSGSARRFDAIHMGRCGLDLYSADVGAPFIEIRSFTAYAGGSPTNVSVGARRLGLNVALLTAVGDDLTGDLVLAAVEREGVNIGFAVRKPGYRTGAALLGIEPPDRFPLVYYRDNCADLQLDLDDIAAAPIADARVLQIAGTNLSRDPSRTATFAAAETARAVGTTVILDLDFRSDQWSDPRAFGVAVRSILPLVDIVLGTDDEINAAVLARRDDVRVEYGQVSDARVGGDSESAIARILASGPAVLVQKLGADGSAIHVRSDGSTQTTSVPGFPVEVCNILGAGDAFAAGFLYGWLNGWELPRAARLGNACGALVVGRHGCSASMPTLDEVEAFVARHELAAADQPA